jgi:hypothetical protein
MRARWNTIMPVVQPLAGLIALSTVVGMFTVSQPASSLAAYVSPVVVTEIPTATEQNLTTGSLGYPPSGAIRTQAQLMVPASAQWETEVSHGSLVLTVASGALEVTIGEGTARTIHHAAPDSFDELTPGESVVLVARDRLVLHSPSTIRTQNVTRDPVIAAVIRIE